MYEVHGELDSKLIVIRCAGFWDDVELAAYCMAVLRLGRTARRPFDMLVDLRNFPVQKAGAGPEVAAMVSELMRMGLRHIAVLAPSAVQRMQANRLGEGRQVFFEDEAAARAWLRRMRIA